MPIWCWRTKSTVPHQRPSLHCWKPCRNIRSLGGSQTCRLEEPFFVLATQNPLETEGTYPLPEAQMDRFLFKLDVAFPNKEELMKIVLTTTDGKVHRASKVMDGKRLLQMREIAQQVPVAEPVAEYLMDLILKTHPENQEAPEVVRQYVRYGASPRGAQAVLQAARIFALLAGRYHVAYEDIKHGGETCPQTSYFPEL